MSNDDDMLADYDLSAWEAPPPPPDLADAVINRLGGTDVGFSVPIDDHREPRRAWIIGGVAVAVIVLGLGVWSLIRATQPAAPATGGVFAAQARTLSLDTVHADLDAGADVRWKREGDVLRVEQRAGRVAWRVAKDEKLVIDAGAASASVEATGANLRVEVEMNATDARVIGATALTAAAVAIVTVVVYEGHVKVGASGQTVVVNPGTTYTVNADRAADETPVVGMAPVTGKKVAILGLEAINSKGNDPVIVEVMNTSMRAIAAVEGPYGLAPGADKELVDEKLLMNCASEAAPCMAAIGANLGADMLVFGRIEHKRDGFDITLKLLDVAKKQLVRSGNWVMPNAEAQAEGLDKWSRIVYLGVVGAATTVCDADALKDEGVNLVSLGQHASALAKFEASLRCKPSGYVVQLAFMEACAASNSVKAKQYYKQLTPAQQQKYAMMCIRTRTAFQDDVADTDASGCDEVSCVLTNYEGDCCKKFRQPVKADSLTRADISEGIAKIKPAVSACGSKLPDGGKVLAKVEVNAKGTVTNVMIAQTPAPAAGACVAAAVQKAAFRETNRGGVFSYPFTFEHFNFSAKCDAKKLTEEGTDLISLGQHSAALSKLEAALTCESTADRLQLAFMEACASSNSQKATQYYKQLSAAQQQKLAQTCIRTNTKYQDESAPACDGDKLKEEGVDLVSLGQHAAALAKFEASLKCAPSPYVVQLAFMEACASSNSHKAKLYYKQMTPEQQDKFAQMCKRTNTPYQDASAGPAVDKDHGYLEVMSTPAAKVLIDGADTGRHTPIRGPALKLTPGRHKVTLVIGADRFTYAVVIKAGETHTMSKELE
jgi:hypothetical protein